MNLMSDFKSHFDSVLQEMFEDYPSVFASMIEKVKDMRVDDRATTANE